MLVNSRRVPADMPDYRVQHHAAERRQPGCPRTLRVHLVSLVATLPTSGSEGSVPVGARRPRRVRGRTDRPDSGHHHRHAVEPRAGFDPPGASTPAGRRQVLCRADEGMAQLLSGTPLPSPGGPLSRTVRAGRIPTFNKSSHRARSASNKSVWRCSASDRTGSGVRAEGSSTLSS